MGPLRFLRLDGPIISEFAFWTSILGYRPEVWTVGLRISAHQTMCANVRLFAKTMTAARGLALNGKFVGGLRHEKGHKSKTVKD